MLFNYTSNVPITKGTSKTAAIKQALATILLVCSTSNYIFAQQTKSTNTWTQSVHSSIGSSTPEIDIISLGTSIVNGDVTPSTTDNTDFSDILVCQNDVHTFTIDNTAGLAGLTVSSIVLSGVNASDFAIGGITLPATVPSGASTTFTLSFAPSAVGISKAVMTINNNDPDEFSYTFNVEGNGTIPPSNIARDRAIDLDGTNDYIDIGDNIEGLSNITFEGWLYYRGTASASFHEICSKTFVNSLSVWNAGGDRLWFQLGDGTTWFDGGPITSNTAIPTNQWTHIAVTWDEASTTVKIYINGILDKAAQHTHSGGAIMGSNTNLRSIGSNFPTSSQFYNGKIDEFRIWNTTRTKAEIRENMHLTLTGCETGLASYYQMNDGIGSSVLTDNTGGGINGTLTNMDVATDWVTSDVNVGNDANANSNSETLTNIPAGKSTQVFTNANMEMEFFEHSVSEDFTVTYQEFSPNSTTNIDGIRVIQNPMWTINKSTTNSLVLADYTFTFPPATFTSTDPTKYSLYWRATHENGDWTKVATANSITATSASFGKISMIGQFIVVQESELQISDVRGNMYQFDGLNDNLLVSGAGPIVPAGATQSITYEFWGYASSTGDGIGSFIVGSNNSVYNTDNNSIQVYMDQNTGAIGGFMHLGGYWVNILDGITSLDEWHHFAIVFDNAANQVDSYLDGILINSVIETGGFDNDLEFMSFGSHGPLGGCCDSELLTGKMDEIRIWSVARNQSEIRENMHLTLKGNETGLEAYYQFNNDDLAGTAGGVKDCIGGNNGTTINMTESNYLPSEVAVAGGNSDRLTITTAGVYSFPNTDVVIEFGATTPAGEIVVSRLETERPNGANFIYGDVDDEYLVINNYGSNSTFTALPDLTIKRMGYIEPNDAATPCVNLSLHKRKSNEYGNTWGAPLGCANSATVGTAGSTSYNSTVNITSFSQIVIVNNSNLSNLPVEWQLFKAKRSSGVQVQLNWNVASEANCMGYEIERMLDGELTFSKVAWIEGQGSTLNTTHYEAIDPNAATVVSYYRLKQINIDGSYEYSEVVAVAGAEKNNNITIFPNPVSNSLNINIQNNATEEVTLRVLDSKGSLVWSTSQSLQDNQLLQIDEIQKWTSGIYVLQVTTDNGQTYNQKFVKE